MYCVIIERQSETWPYEYVHAYTKRNENYHRDMLVHEYIIQGEESKQIASQIFVQVYTGVWRIVQS